MNMESFMSISSAIMDFADFLCYIFFVYAGIVWMSGDRTKALERAVGVGSGYLIIRKAMFLRDFLKALSILPVVMKLFEGM